MTRLHVLVVAACPFPAGRGSQLLVERTTRGLIERGHRVELLCARFGEPGRADPAGLGGALRRAGLPRLRRGVDSRPSPLRVIDDALLAIAALRADPDVIVGHNVEGGLIAGLAGRALRRACVWVRHSVFAEELAISSHWPAASRALGGAAERFCDRLADRVVLVSGGKPQPEAATRVEHLPPPIDPDESTVAPADGATLYYEGNRDPYQNPAWLEATLRVVRERRPEARLLTATSPAGRPGRADLALVPRTLGGGFPMKLLAYQVAGIPALCARTGAPGAVDGLDAFLVDGGPETFARRAADLLDRPDLLRQVRETARTRALERNDPHRVAALLEGCLGRAIAGTRATAYTSPSESTPPLLERGGGRASSHPRAGRDDGERRAGARPGH